LSTALEQRIDDLISPTLEGMGFTLVRVALIGGSRTRTLQVMAERSAGREAAGTMSVDDCADVSRALSAVLDVADPIDGEYVLEVSSPGIDRPLVRLDDYDRFVGHEAKLELAVPIEGRKRFRGLVVGTETGGADGDAVVVEVETTEGRSRVSLPHADIRTAKLVLTDALLAAGREMAKAGVGAG
jgi:ribosome maturation factor RimP